LGLAKGWSTIPEESNGQQGLQRINGQTSIGEVTAMQTLKDRRSSSVFLVTDVLRGVRYFVADKGSHYEIQVPRRAGYVRVAVPRDADVIEVADELIRELDTAENVCFTPRAPVESSS